MFYPKKNMSGATILYEGKVLEGTHHLAEEAKYLPHLIETSLPPKETELVNNLIKIIEIYNAVIAPDSFILTVDSRYQLNIIKQFEKSTIISEQVNSPEVLFVDNFQYTLDMGLRWLITKDTVYSL